MFVAVEKYTTVTNMWRDTMSGSAVLKIYARKTKQRFFYIIIFV